MNETIFSLSTGSLPSGVAVIRVSGPNVRFAVETMCGFVPTPRRASYRVFLDQDGTAIDRGLILFFPGPHSFTGEDSAEFHVHGGRAVVDAMLSRLGKLNGLRQAEAGEFTRQAFANGKLDLTGVEGLSDLLAAQTEAQRIAALDQADGSLRHLFEGWMARLTHARAMLEAEFDFSDEEDIPGAVSDQIWPDLVILEKEIGTHIEGIHWGEIVRDGFRIALVGAPNVGKSTLLNRLADRDVAIVSDRPGTTRDTVEVRLDIGGYLVLVKDTAGVRDTDDEIESEGIRRALDAARSSDLVIWLDDGSDTAGEYGIATKLALIDTTVVAVRSKMDLVAGNLQAGDWSIGVSAHSGEGIEELVSRIKAEIMTRKSRVSTAPNRNRHRELLGVCRGHIMQAIELREAGGELSASELREAAAALGRITGHVGVEDLLGVIFSEFCVGK